MQFLIDVRGSGSVVQRSGVERTQSSLAQVKLAPLSEVGEQVCGL